METIIRNLLETDSYFIDDITLSPEDLDKKGYELTTDDKYLISPESFPLGVKENKFGKYKFSIPSLYYFFSLESNPFSLSPAFAELGRRSLRVVANRKSVSITYNPFEIPLANISPDSPFVFQFQNGAAKYCYTFTKKKKARAIRENYINNFPNNKLESPYIDIPNLEPQTEREISNISRHKLRPFEKNQIILYPCSFHYPNQNLLFNPVSGLYESVWNSNVVPDTIINSFYPFNDELTLLFTNEENSSWETDLLPQFIETAGATSTFQLFSNPYWCEKVKIRKIGAPSFLDLFQERKGINLSQQNHTRKYITLFGANSEYTVDVESGNLGGYFSDAAGLFFVELLRK
jgi:hypothetical protein